MSEIVTTDSLSERLKKLIENSSRAKGYAELGLDVVGEFFPIVSAVKDVNEFRQRENLYWLLKGISNDLDIERIRNEFYNYSSNPERAEYMVSVFKQVVNSSSRKVNVAIGMQVGRLMKNDVNPSQVDIATAETLFLMNDFDIENFILTYDYIQTNPRKLLTQKHLPEVNPDNQVGLEITLNKLAMHDAINIDTTDMFQEELLINSKTYSITSFGKVLYESIKKAGPILDYSA